MCLEVGEHHQLFGRSKGIKAVLQCTSDNVINRFDVCFIIVPDWTGVRQWCRSIVEIELKRGPVSDWNHTRCIPMG
jgi:predicted metalloenzyme YecM